MHIELLTIGDELLDGAIVDSNSAWLGRRLDALGHRVMRRTTIRDDQATIAATLKAIASRADLCIVSGGLGPTDDDLTVPGLCAAAGVETTFDPAAWQRIVDRYGDRPIPPLNRRQAQRPVGGALLASTVGTASCVHLRFDGCDVFCTPGVPREMRWQFETHIEPRLAAGPDQRVMRSQRFALIGESTIAERVAAAGLPSDVEIAWRAIGPINEVKLRGAGAAVDAALARIRAACPAEHLGDHPSLAHATIAALKARGLTFGTAESCTGGLVGAALTDVPGASAVFWGGIISYANAVKQHGLGVPEQVLVEHGAVSEPCARAMAEGARKALGVDVAVAITGIAGPGGGSAEKPVGTVWFGWAGAGLDATRMVRLRGDRARVREFAVAYALDHVRRGLAAGGDDDA